MQRFFPAIILFLLLFASCQQAPVEYVHQVDTLYIRDTLHVLEKGVLHGKAGIFTAAGLATDNSGITVTMESTSTHSTTTDSTGNWTMRDLPTGSYNIVISREGFEPYKVFAYYFMAGADSYFILPDVAASYRANYPVLVDHLAPASVSAVGMTQSRLIPDKWYLSGQVGPVLPNVTLSLYFGRDSSLLVADSSTFLMLKSIGGGGHWESTNNDLVQSGFQRGEQVFLVCFSTYRYYPSAPAIASYWDPYSNSVVTPAVLKQGVRSNVVSFTLP